MLNKDEYNQEEYNDYYRQETQGAELNGSNDDEGGGIGKLIWLLLLIILGVAGYFGYKMMEKSNSDDALDKSLQVSIDTLPQSVQNETETQKSNEPVEEEQTEVKEETNLTTIIPKVEVKKEDLEKTTIQKEVSEKVQQAVASSSSSKMSPEKVATIVAAVMKQINQEKNSSIQLTPTVEKQDKDLMNKLSSTEVDSVSTDLENALENIDINENTHIDNSKEQIDVYNKVNVQNAKGTDSLSQLSELITNEIEDAKVSSTTATTTSKEYKDYSRDIKKEVVFREKEMRIIVVRKGDTLGKIAKRAYGNVMNFKRIYKANPEITRPDRIYVGQKIRIPN